MVDDFMYYDFCGTSGLEDMLARVIGVLLVLLAVVLVVAVAFYVMTSLSLYTIAKRRGIRNPGLAWVPVANQWVMGCISDQYKYVTKGQVKNRRTVMLTLSIVSVALSMISAPMNMVFPGGGVLFAIAEYGVAIASLVFWYLALYDLYASCNPDNSVLFLVLSIVLAVTTPFFLLACRKKDQGMPPRKTAQPEYRPISEPREQPPQEPQWAQDRPEPWEQNNEE